MFPQVLVCDVTGNPHDWMCWQTAVINKVKGNIAYEIGDSDILARGGISRMSGLRSQVNVSPIICLKGKFKRKDNIPLNNANLFRRDLSVCAYCGKTFREDKLSRDHIIPRARGGKDIWTNVVTACKPCNNYKDSMTPEEADMQLLYVPYVPSHCEELILKNRRILGCQMDFLKAFLPSHSRLISPNNY